MEMIGFVGDFEVPDPTRLFSFRNLGTDACFSARPERDPFFHFA
jgi:hypothetical protein